MATTGSNDSERVSLATVTGNALRALGVPQATSTPDTSVVMDDTPTLSTISGPRVAPYATPRVRAQRSSRGRAVFRRSVFD